ncbi:uncharacterized protein NEMAJ01_2316 [Nematocida major]|uniref:uncharacterized protein n=1 Tax=Nematocida major TaxID=1912982 RepID=UPI002007F421|nr:uncharacterized protein NEMAJ01_2316 [Nematocida major]KAH9387420.1 hypothetical protein NEMAJ01_2316 [Nematocida major]
MVLEPARRPVLRPCESLLSMQSMLSAYEIRSISLEEGLFPEALLGEIEAQRERILRGIFAFNEARKEKNKKQKNHPESGANLDEFQAVRACMRGVLLEVEKLQALTGNGCVRECGQIIREMEKVHAKICGVSGYSGFLGRAGAISAVCAVFGLVGGYFCACKFGDFTR